KSAPSHQKNVIYQSETTDTETIDISANNLVEDETVVIDKNGTVTHTIANTEIATQTLETHQPKEQTTVLSATDQRLLDGLNSFEQEKGYLASLTLDDLAEKLNTSRSTLSAFLNEHKKGFSTYINNLRIQQAVSDLKTDKEL